VGNSSAIEYLDAGGNQESAFEYGSAFSRACRAKTLAGETIYISGTASIGADGKTLYTGDPRRQIEATIANVCAVLKECGCNDGDVMHAIAYSKTPDVEKVFTDGWSGLAWPIIPVIADICRDDLLFEIEVTAAKNAEI
jgi:enamine deaminase RidA (YjgF/YER057c/UK114 family)